MPSVRGGFGVQSGQQQVTSVVLGANAVVPNAGVGVQIQALSPSRLTTLRWRVDLSPDVPAGTTSVPTKWRVVVFSAASFPGDISGLQSQAYPAGSHPEIPAQIGSGAPVTILHDEWLDFAQGDPGLNAIASRDWTGGGGPSAGDGNVLCVLLVPIIDANMDQSIIGASNAVMYLEAYGVEEQSDAGNGSSAHSLPRYDVTVR